MGSSVSLASQRRRFAFAVPLALALAATFALLLEPTFSLAVRQSVSGLGLLLAGVLAAVSCAVRAAQTRGRRQRSWRLLMAAGLVAVAGNIWVTVSGADPVASPSSIGNGSIALALMLSIAGLLSFPSVRRRGIDQLLMSLDGLVAGSAVLVIASVLVYSELLDSVTDDLASRSTALLFPVLDVVLATVAILLILRTSGPDRPALGLVTGGFLMYAVADLAFAVLAAQDRFHFGTTLDLGWIAGYLLIGLAAWYPSDQADGAAPHPEGGASDARGTIVVFGVLLTAGVVQVVFGPGGHLPGTQSALWLVLILAAGTRQMLLAADNATLRRGLERRVREQTADLSRLARQNEVLLTSVGDGIYGVDHDGRVTFINPSGASALGYDPAQLHGRRAHDAFHAPDDDGMPFPWSGCYITDAILSGMVASAEEDVYVRADGETFPVEITASPLVDDDEVRGAVVVFRDVTQRREVERMKNEFLSVVSHELRTPLTSIRGSLGLLAGGKLGELPPRADSLVGIALQSSERLTRLINDLLDIERIEAGTRPMEIATLDACELLHQAATSIEGLASPTRVRVEVGACSGRVLADEDRIMQTLTNLLGNAIKYSPAGSVVVLDATERADHVLFRVADRGRGIPQDKLETVFERFEQVDSSDAREKGGTGLGLAISRGIVERHGGRIWAESELGSGTTVLFTLPSAPALTAGGRQDAGPREGSVLLVEDDADLARVITALLVESGLDVLHAATAAEAVARARERRPRALVLDLELPDGDGAEVVAELRRDRDLREMPLVVYSAADVAPDRRAALELGPTAFLTKGRVSPEELRERLVGLIGATAGWQQGHTRD
ncbi:hypothetical protein GCM10009844_07640 [Nocardioides koreensis]|uniref:histidine kinase n=1 Tax=Nocardioides koreensis TaxID=433651 RepID=A0ABP5L4R4_9ACTN